MCKFFLKIGFDVNTIDDSGHSLLMWAVQGKHAEMTDLLLSKGADVNYQKKKFGITALMLAAECNPENIAIVNKLLAKKAAVNAKDKLGGYNSLMRAASRANIKTVEVLIDHGADVNGRNEWGETALMQAKNKSVAEFLIARGADLNIKDRSNNTALAHAAKAGDLKIIQFLFEKGIANIENNYEKAFLTAAEHGRTETVNFFADKVVSIDTKDILGNTALVIAAGKGDFATSKLLVEKGADVNAAGYEGMTAFLTAVKYGYNEIAEFLISKGARLDVKNSFGSTALTLAEQHGHRKIVSLLYKHGIGGRERGQDDDW